MNITRESILGVGQGTSLVNTDWLRPHTPYTKDKKETNYNKCGYKSPIVVLKI